MASSEKDNDDRHTDEEAAVDDSDETPPGSPEIISTSQFGDTVPIDDDTQVLDDVDLELLVVDSEGEGTDTTQVLNDDDEAETHSGQAVPEMRLAGTDGEARPVQGNSQHLEVIGKDSDRDVIMDGTRDDSKCMAGKSTVRRLFTGDAPDSDSSLPELGAEDHQFAGLSYVGSQLPGDESQADALNLVDRLISVEEELHQEMNWGSAAKVGSPPSSRTKGVHVLAQRVMPRSPVGDADIFDWDDSHEDEGGGFFFSKRKEELLGVSCHRRRSNTQPKKNPNPQNAKKGKGTVDKIRDEEKVPQKTKSRSTTRLLSHNSNENEKIQPTSRSRTRKNRSDESDGQQKFVTSDEHLEATGMSKDSLDVCDVGIDTQLAADAMEALGSGVPSNLTTGVACQAEQYGAKCCPRDDATNNVCSKKVPRQRTSYSGSMSRRSERLKKLDSSLISEPSPKNSIDQQTQRVISDSRGKGRKVSARKHLNTTAANQNKACNTRSSKSVSQVHPVNEINETHIEKVDTLPQSSTLCEKLSHSKKQMDDGQSIVTPVSHCTRNSLAVNPSKGCKLSCDNTGNETNDVVEASNGDGKRRRKGFVDDAAEGQEIKVKSSKLLDSEHVASDNKTSDQMSSKSISKVNLLGVMNNTHNNGADGLHGSPTSNGNLPFHDEETGEDCRIFTPVARRTRGSLTVNPLEGSEFSCKDTGNGIDVVKTRKGYKRRSLGGDVTTGNTANSHSSVLSKSVQREQLDCQSYEFAKLDAPTTAHVPKANEQAVTKQKKLRVSGANGVKLDQKRRTRSSVHFNPSELSSKKNPKGSCLEKPEVEPTMEELNPPYVQGRGDMSPFDLGGSGIKPIQNEPSGVIHETLAKTCCEARDVHRYPRRKRTHENISKHTDETNADAPSTTHEIEANGQKIGNKENLKVDETNSCPKTNQKRITRSHGRCNTSLLSSEDKPEGSVGGQHAVRLELTESASNSHPSVSKEKLVRKGNLRDEFSTLSGKGHGEESLVKGVGVDAGLHVSFEGKVKQSGTAITPSSTCTSPTNAASPLCIGNGYDANLCKKSLTRSPLLKELNRLDANEVLPSTTSKDLRKRKDMTALRVLFSHHLNEDTIRQQKKILVRLGASIAESSSEASHFVADKFARTRNMLEAIASGKPVVTHLWLESCAQASCFIDEKNYILRDSKKEKEIGFSMPVSLAHASHSPLLESKLVYITPNVKPSQELITSLVKTVHGQVVEKLGRTLIKDDKLPDDLLILSCEEDYALCVPLLEKGALIYGSELLLNGIVIQKLEYERHRLFADHGKRTRSTVRVKGNGYQDLPVAKRKKR